MRIVTGALAVLAWSVLSAHAEPGVSEGEIRIGQTLPYSGPMSGYSAIGKVAEGYFEKVNAEGGVGGRKLRLISLDDAYSPPKTVEQTRKLVEQDDVLLIFGTLGTPTNSAIHRYLNAKHVPQLFLNSGAEKWADPKHYPWTMSGMVSYQSEGAIYANYILRNKPDAKIAILSQNDDYGRDYLNGFKRALGDKAAGMIVAETVYETTQPTIDSQLATLKSSGANTFFSIAIGKFASQVIRRAAEMGWKPELFIVPTSATYTNLLQSAGFDNATGLVSAAYQKNVNDPQWADDGEVTAYYAFMKQYAPSVDPHDTAHINGYLGAHLLVQVLRNCGDDLSRDNVLRQATSLNNVSLPLLLPGVKVSTGPDDYHLFEQMRLQRFDGKNWIGFGELIDAH